LRPIGRIFTACRVDHEVSSLASRTNALGAEELATPMEPGGSGEGKIPGLPRQPGCFGGIVIARRARPLARRRLSTLRPPGVAIRARKP
jgi:hypothetical protein